MNVLLICIAGKPIGTELRGESNDLRKELQYDDEETKGEIDTLFVVLFDVYCFCYCTELKTHIDDEYAMAGVNDPKVLITTSREPSSRLSQVTQLAFSISICICAD